MDVMCMEETLGNFALLRPGSCPMVPQLSPLLPFSITALRVSCALGTASAPHLVPGRAEGSAGLNLTCLVGCESIGCVRIPGCALMKEAGIQPQWGRGF